MPSLRLEEIEDLLEEENQEFVDLKKKQKEAVDKKKELRFPLHINE